MYILFFKCDFWIYFQDKITLLDEHEVQFSKKAKKTSTSQVKKIGHEVRKRSLTKNSTAGSKSSKKSLSPSSSFDSPDCSSFNSGQLQFADPNKARVSKDNDHSTEQQFKSGQDQQNPNGPLELEAPLSKTDYNLQGRTFDYNSFGTGQQQLVPASAQPAYSIIQSEPYTFGYNEGDRFALHHLQYWAPNQATDFGIGKQQLIGTSVQPHHNLYLSAPFTASKGPAESPFNGQQQNVVGAQKVEKYVMQPSGNCAFDSDRRHLVVGTGERQLPGTSMQSQCCGSNDTGTITAARINEGRDGSAALQSMLNRVQTNPFGLPGSKSPFMSQFESDYTLPHRTSNGVSVSARQQQLADISVQRLNRSAPIIVSNGERGTAPAISQLTFGHQQINPFGLPKPILLTPSCYDLHCAAGSSVYDNGYSDILNARVREQCRYGEYAPVFDGQKVFAPSQLPYFQTAPTQLQNLVDRRSNSLNFMQPRAVSTAAHSQIYEEAIGQPQLQAMSYSTNNLNLEALCAKQQRVSKINTVNGVSNISHIYFLFYYRLLQFYVRRTNRKLLLLKN